MHSVHRGGSAGTPRRSADKIANLYAKHPGGNLTHSTRLRQRHPAPPSARESNPITTLPSPPLHPPHRCRAKWQLYLAGRLAVKLRTNTIHQCETLATLQRCNTLDTPSPLRWCMHRIRRVPFGLIGFRATFFVDFTVRSLPRGGGFRQGSTASIPTSPLRVFSSIS